MSNKPTKPVLLVKKSDSKKAKLWNDLTNDRIIRQHGGHDIPEGDLHAVKKFDTPVQFPQTTPEETESALSDLTKQIEQLKNKNQ